MDAITDSDIIETLQRCHSMGTTCKLIEQLFDKRAEHIRYRYNGYSLMAYQIEDDLPVQELMNQPWREDDESA